MLFSKRKELCSEIDEELFLYRGLLESCSLPYYVRDMNYNIILWSQPMEQLTGYKPEEVLGKKCKDIFKTILCNDDCPCTKCALDRTKFYDAPVTIYNKQGQAIPTLVSSAGVYNRNGEVLGCAEFIKDDRDYVNLHQNAQNSSEQSYRLYEEINQSINTIQQSTDNLSHAITETSSNITNCEQASQQMLEASNHCTDQTAKVTNMLNTLEQEMGQCINLIRSVENNMKEIQELSKQIENISFQTNMLALNASIESTRAGSYGKGFAVVAQSIKDLANNTAQLTAHIGETIEHAKQTTTQTVAHSSQTQEQLQRCKSEIDVLNVDVHSMNQQIDTFTNNITEINSTIVDVEHSVVEQNASTHSLNETSSQFMDLLTGTTAVIEGLKR